MGDLSVPTLGWPGSGGPLSKAVPTQSFQLVACMVVTLDSLLYSLGLSFLSSITL